MNGKILVGERATDVIKHGDTVFLREGESLAFAVLWFYYLFMIYVGAFLVTDDSCESGGRT